MNTKVLEENIGKYLCDLKGKPSFLGRDRKSITKL